MEPKNIGLRGIMVRVDRALERATQEEFQETKGEEIYADVDFYRAPGYHYDGDSKRSLSPCFFDRENCGPEACEFIPLDEWNP